MFSERHNTIASFLIQSLVMRILPAGDLLNAL